MRRLLIIPVTITYIALFLFAGLASSAQLTKRSFAKTLLPEGFLDKTDKSRIKATGIAHRIYTKYGNFRLQSILSEDDNHPYIISDEKTMGLLDKWQLIGYEKDLNQDYVYIVSAFSGLNIHVPGADKSPNVVLHLDRHKSKGYNNELFELLPTGEEGWVYIRNRNSNLYLSIGPPFKEYFQYIFLNRFVLAPKHTPMVLRIMNGRAEMIYDNRANAEELNVRAFTAEPISGLKSSNNKVDVFYLVNGAGGIKLVVDGKTEAGTRLTGDNLASTKGESGFKFEKISDNLYKIVLAKNPALCVEVKNGDKDNKTPLVLGRYSGLPHQQFYFFNADAHKLMQVKDPGDSGKFRFEEAGGVDWKGR